MKKDDTGIALFTVVMMSAILFMLTTSLLVLEQYYVNMVSLRSNRVDATHIADAGLNDYLYHIKNNRDYYKTTPDTGWVVFDGARYKVRAEAPTDTTPLTLYATGAADNTVTIVATVRYPTFAEYMFLSDSDMTFGDKSKTQGSVRSNGSIRNDGHITGKTYAVGAIDGSGQFDQGKYPFSAPANFDQVSVSLDTMMTAAKNNSPTSYFGQSGSGAYGYLATFAGTYYTVEKITGGTDTGTFTKTLVSFGAIPANGAIYFDDTVWIQGNYAMNLTIASTSDVYFNGSYARTDTTAKYTSGVIARNNIIIPIWSSGIHDTLNIDAAILAQTGKFYADTKNDHWPKFQLNFNGAAAFKDGSGNIVSDTGNNSSLTGFTNRVYTYDQALDMNPPLYYPSTGDGALKVATWIDSGGIR